MWMMEAKKPVEIYARSWTRRSARSARGIDATAGVITFEDGAIYQSAISWALPIVWPGAVYSLEVGITGHGGRDHRSTTRTATSCLPRRTRAARAYAPDNARRVDFLAATRRATWCSASCAARCAKRPSSG